MSSLYLLKDCGAIQEQSNLFSRRDHTSFQVQTHTFTSRFVPSAVVKQLVGGSEFCWFLWRQSRAAVFWDFSIKFHLPAALHQLWVQENRLKLQLMYFFFSRGSGFSGFFLVGAHKGASYCSGSLYEAAEGCVISLKTAAEKTAGEALSNQSNEYMHHLRALPARTLFVVVCSKMCDNIIYQGIVQLKCPLIWHYDNVEFRFWFEKLLHTVYRRQTIKDI